MSTSLTPEQRGDVAGARALILASERGPEALAAYITERGHPVQPGDCYPEAFGVASVLLGDLLRIIDGLAGGAS